MLLAVDLILVNRGMECLLQSAYGAGNLQRLLARIYLEYLEALGLEPVLDGLHILVTGSELLSKLFGGQPFVKIRGARGMHVMQQLLQAGLLLRAALQKQLYPIQLHIGRNGAAVVAGVGQRVDGTGQRDPGMIIYRLGQARQPAAPTWN